MGGWLCERSGMMGGYTASIYVHDQVLRYYGRVKWDAMSSLLVAELEAGILTRHAVSP